jgi:osmotically-inducible protein OsmY
MFFRRAIQLFAVTGQRAGVAGPFRTPRIATGRWPGPGLVRRVALGASIALALWYIAATECSAQMSRSGRASTLSGATGADLSGAGQVTGNERFVRRNRPSGSFVGNDVRQRRGFIGQQSANLTGRVRIAAEQARISVAPSVNREAASTVNRSTGVYEPRLAVGFDVERPSDVQITVRTVLQLHLTHAFPPATRIEVSVADGIATLRGEVSCERDRSLAERLVLFEPGIAGVRNELQVKPAPPNAVLPGSPASKPTSKPPAKS